MPRKRKLQVFVSSTFADLKEERQAAVEAILTAGHIPAGMELFAAGDESQMNVIKRWIEAAGLTRDKLARLLGVSVQTISEILNERRPLTTDIAHRLARAFGTSPEMWLGLQHDVDLWDTN